MKMKVCSSCGYMGEPVNQCLESFLLDLFVWLIVGSITLMTGLLPLLIIPATWTVYHVFRFKSKCPECENLDMVSIKSEKGKETLAYTHQ